MIVDFHTHIFPPAVVTNRDSLLTAEPVFKALYADSDATLASHDDLIQSMDGAGIDASVALGFAWMSVESCRSHNDYLLDVSRQSHGRILAFCTLPLKAGPVALESEARRCVAAGAHGFGELRPDDVAFDLNGPDGSLLARLARQLDVPLLFHVTEPVGHAYPGKAGLSLERFYAFACAHPGVKLVGAHWGGGLPFFAAMPEVRRTLDRVFVDTAASSLLYTDDVFDRVSGLIGSQSILFGSDFPLLSQARSKRRVDEANLDDATRDLILGGNAVRLLGLL